MGKDTGFGPEGAQTLRWVVQSHPAVGGMGRERSGREIMPSQDMQPRNETLSRDSLSRESELHFEDIDPDRQLFQHFQEPAYRYVGDQNALSQQRQSDPLRCWGFSILLSAVGLAAALLCYRQFSAPTTTGGPSNSMLQMQPGATAYDCKADFDKWQLTWSLSKRDWCCDRYARGCPVGQKPSMTLQPTLIPSGEVSATSAPFNCMNGLFNWAARWSSAKKEFCCTHGWQGGCAASTSAGLRSSTAAPHPAKSGSGGGGDLFRTSASLPAQSSRSAAGCDVACKVDGMDAPCIERMKYAALNEFKGQPKACHQAAQRVTGQCPACSGCSMEDFDSAFCPGLEVTETSPPATTAPPRPTTTIPPPTPTPTPPPTPPPVLEMTTPAASPAPSADSNERYDCFQRLQNWEQTWSVGQKAWCCQHHRKGCPNVGSVPFNCFTGIQDRWSKPKKQYCCSHSNVGCGVAAAPEYDCQDHLDQWIDHWSLGKKEFCCERVHCPTM